MSRLTGILTALTHAHPDVRIEVIVTDAVLDFVDHNIDLALRGRDPGTDSLVARRLSQGRSGLFASADYASAHADAVRRGDLTGCALYDPFRQAGLVQGLQLSASEPAFATTSLEMCKALAVQSAGVALLPHATCEAEVAAGSLVELDCDCDFPELPLYLVMPGKRLLPARVRALIDHFVDSNRSVPLL